MLLPDKTYNYSIQGGKMRKLITILLFMPALAFAHDFHPGYAQSGCHPDVSGMKYNNVSNVKIKNRVINTGMNWQQVKKVAGTSACTSYSKDRYGGIVGATIFYSCTGAGTRCVIGGDGKKFLVAVSFAQSEVVKIETFKAR